ncbi:MAG: sulfatase [Candidatus Omnitrophota bacterium]
MALSKDKPLNVLLITIDALRPDHLGCYGYRRNTSPNIDQLAKNGVRFTQAITQGTITEISLSSLITSTYLSTHGVYTSGHVIPNSIPTLVELLKSKNYKTCLINGRGVKFFQKPSYERALDMYINAHDFNARNVTFEAIRWLNNNKKSKFFMWLHYFDPHAPYFAPPEYRSLFINDEYYRNGLSIPISDNCCNSYNDIPSTVAIDGITDVNYYIAQYDSEIKFSDEQIGHLINEISKLGLLKNTIIIITADHGEYLGEHGIYFIHGSLFEQVVKVPLIIMCNKIIPKGKVINSQVGLIDIMPTILDLLKDKNKMEFDGISLMPLISGKPNKREYIFSEFINKNTSARAIRSAEWKLVYYDKDNNYSLFNLRDDPLESINLVNVKAKEFNILKNKLNGFLNSKKVKNDNLSQFHNEQDIDKLRSLGYIQ